MTPAMDRKRLVPRPPRDIPSPVAPPETVFVRSFPIGWGDLDPAQIAYTGRLPDLVVRASEGWIASLLGGSFFDLQCDYGLDTPFVHLSVDFHSPVTTEAPLDCAVHVERVGTTSLPLVTVARQAGRHAFTARTVQVFVDLVTFRPSPIPDNVRASIAAYRDRFPVPAEALRPAR